MRPKKIEPNPLQALIYAKDKIAFTSGEHKLTYIELENWAQHLARTIGESPLVQEQPIGILAPSSFEFVAALCGIWKAHGLAVPLQPQHPKAELEYIIQDSCLKTVFVHPDYMTLARSLQSAPDKSKLKLVEIRAPKFGPLKTNFTRVDRDRGALMIYTSGTTSRPKGAVLTFGNLNFQTSTLCDAWGWTEDDRTLNVLPLHHVHGLINILCCSLVAGACCELLTSFDAEKTWERLASGRITVFMAVPTIYSKLVQYWENQSQPEQKRLSEAASKLRLMVSGSAALALPLFERWKAITSHSLLERYGMTEVGMALSNPYREERRPKSVGFPLPGVEVRLTEEGEIHIKSPGVFREYWGKPDLTRSGFTADGWFKTGDIANCDENGYFYIQGRASQDIIKTGGYKISALEIESALLENASLLETAIVGIPDPEWGERIVAVCVWRTPAIKDEFEKTDFKDIKNWLKTRLAHYKIPSKWISVEALPRNAMGKVTKPALRDLCK